MLRLTSPDAKLFRLVLAVGSRAGLEAPLQTGYYMIGRHKECQVRPKSRSVSRRHCLLHNDGGVLRLLDLNSTAGTFLNDERIESGRWYELSESDHLRCGKVVFTVSCVNAVIESESIPAHESRLVNDSDDSEASQAILSGNAWQNFDVVDFLEAEDNADQEKRYQTIRSAVGKNDTQTQSQASDALQEVDHETVVSEGEQEKVRHASSSEIKRSSPTRAEKTGKLKPRKSPSIFKSRRSTSSRHSADSDGIWERGKFLGASILAAAVVTFFCYSVVSFYAGPETKVLQELD